MEVIWFTGLSGSGKTTLARKLLEWLQKHNKSVCLLDGDEIRKSINNDLGFANKDRDENIRRIREMAKLLSQYNIVIVSCITPFEKQRKINREQIENYFEIYIKCSFEECTKRDVKGLYKQNIKNFTGKDSKFEEPENPDLIIDTEHETIEESFLNLTNFFTNL